MGEALTFVREDRPPGFEVTSYVFADASGALRTFDVPDEMPAMALYQRFSRGGQPRWRLSGMPGAERRAGGVSGATEPWRRADKLLPVPEVHGSVGEEPA